MQVNTSNYVSGGYANKNIFAEHRIGDIILTKTKGFANLAVVGESVTIQVFSSFLLFQIILHKILDTVVLLHKKSKQLNYYPTI